MTQPQSKPLDAQLPPFEEWWREYEKLEIHKQSQDLLNRDAIAKRIAREAWNAAASRRTGEGQTHFETFQAGWNAGFQEAQEPDRFPWQNRCEVRYRELFPLAATPAPVESERCVNHCGHPLIHVEKGVCQYPVTFSRMCRHVCDFSRPARLGCAAHGFKFREDCEACNSTGVEPQTDVRPVSEAAKRAAERIADAHRSGELGHAVKQPRDRQEFVGKVSAIIQTELTKE